MTETYHLSSECQAFREVTKPALSRARGRIPRWRLKVNMVKEEPSIGERTVEGVVRRHEMSKVARGCYPRGLGGYRGRAILVIAIGPRHAFFVATFRRLPLSRCTVQNGILYVRERAAIIRRKRILQIATAAAGVPRAGIFLDRLDQSPHPTSAPLQLFLECWEWFISVTKKVKSIPYGKCISRTFAADAMLSYLRALILFKYVKNSRYKRN